MIIVYGDYLDLNNTHPYRRHDSTTQEEADFLQVFWDLFKDGKLKLENKRVSESDWEHCVWIDVCNEWFGKNGYTTYALVKPSVRPRKDLVKERNGNWWIDKDNGVVVTEWFYTQGSNYYPTKFEDYAPIMREYEQKEFKRLTDKMPESIDWETQKMIQSRAYDNLQKWMNKTEARWWHK